MVSAERLTMAIPVRSAAIASPADGGELVQLVGREAREVAGEALLQDVLTLAMANADRPRVLAAMAEAGKRALG